MEINKEYKKMVRYLRGKSGNSSNIYFEHLIHIIRYKVDKFKKETDRINSEIKKHSISIVSPRMTTVTMVSCFDYEYLQIKNLQNQTLPCLKKEINELSYYIINNNLINIEKILFTKQWVELCLNDSKCNYVLIKYLLNNYFAIVNDFLEDNLVCNKIKKEILPLMI